MSLLAVLLWPFSTSHAGSSFQCEKPLSDQASGKLLSEVENRYTALLDLTAEFVQRSYFLGLDQRVESKGKVYFKKPGMMDWEYEKPEKQRFVADGQSLWFFQPDLNQVTVGEFTKSFQTDLPVSFLLGVGNVREKFDLKQACVKAASAVLHLVPKSADPNLQEFFLLVDARDYTPYGAKMVDAGGNETEIEFSALEVNTQFSEDRFRFAVPKGVDIIDHRQPSGTPEPLPATGS